MSQTETAGAPNALDVRDARTGKSYSFPIMEPGTEVDTAMLGMDLRQVKAGAA